MLNRTAAAVLVGQTVLSAESVAEIRRLLSRREGARTSRRKPLRAGRVARGVQGTAGHLGRQLADGARELDGDVAAERGVLPEGLVFRRAELREHPCRQPGRPQGAQDSDPRHGDDLQNRRRAERRPVAASLSLPDERHHQLLQAELHRRKPSVQSRLRLHQLRISPAAAREAARQLSAAVQQRHANADDLLESSGGAVELRQLPRGCTCRTHGRSAAV